MTYPFNERIDVVTLTVLSNNILINWHVWIVLEKKTLILRFYVYIEMVYMERILFNEDASEETS